MLVSLIYSTFLLYNSKRAELISLYTALLSIPAFTVPVVVAQQSSPASSVFVYNGFAGSNFTFAINLASNSQDISFHLNGPSKFSWIAVGTGTEMKDSLIFVAYHCANGKSKVSSAHWLLFTDKLLRRRDIKPQNRIVSGLTPFR